MISFAPGANRGKEAKIRIGSNGVMRISKNGVLLAPTITHTRLMVHLTKDGVSIVVKPGETGYTVRGDDGGIECNIKRVAEYLKKIGFKLPIVYGADVRWDANLQAWTAKMGA